MRKLLASFNFMRKPQVSVLFVCTANICRSPMAEGILIEELKLRGWERKVRVDSAGAIASQPGHRADGRARQVCAREGVDLRKSRARQVIETDFSHFDYLLAMDEKNLAWLLKNSPPIAHQRISLLSSWNNSISASGRLDIPDPYYGTIVNFEQVLALMHPAIDGFMLQLQSDLFEAQSSA